jgi:hypothetical protein
MASGVFFVRLSFSHRVGFMLLFMNQSHIKFVGTAIWRREKVVFWSWGERVRSSNSRAMQQKRAFLVNVGAAYY